MTAKEIACKYLEVDSVELNNLELDILRYLQYHYAKWNCKDEKTGDYIQDCEHIWKTDDHTEDSLDYCIKCNQLKPPECKTEE